MDILSLTDLFQTAFLGMAVVAGVFFMMRYLSRNESPSIKKQIEEIKSDFNRIVKEGLNNSVSAKSVVDLKDQIDELKRSQLAVSDNERNELIGKLTEKIRKEAADNLLSEIRERAKQSAEKLSNNELVEKQFFSTIERLKEELFSLSKRGNLNLSIGIMTTIVGLALLGTFVLSTQNVSKDLSEFTIGFLPRISLVLLIEIFAYFFLGLYKSILGEIKYFQNEITSIESKYLALKVAMQSQDSDNVKHVIEQLSKTERNFILEKGQSTVDLEKSRAEQQLTADIIGKVTNLVGKRS